MRLPSSSYARFVSTVVSRSVLAAFGMAAVLTTGMVACGDDHLGSELTGGAGGTGGTGNTGGSAVSSTTDAVNVSVGTTSTGGAGMGGGGGMIDPTGCGDGAIQPGEVCDDGNSQSGDGCAGDCLAIESDFACPTPGQPCVSTVVCGDGNITGAETCEDGNTTSGDGCSDMCAVEPGWVCNGLRCSAAQCGDGIIAGAENCEDGGNPAVSGDGCSDTCQREFGFHCPAINTLCQPTVCGDGMKQGDEPCDDGNQIVGDGCGPFCEVEPNCAGGACSSACGDGMILAADNEQCDDGNTNDGDGCSSQCVIESGFVCNNVQGTLPPALDVPVVYRDMVALPQGGSTRHPDFEVFGASQETPGLVQTTLDVMGKPVATGNCMATLQGSCPYGQQLTSVTNYEQWYRNTAGVNIPVVTTMTLNRQPDDTYFLADTTFFPVDALGWVALGDETTVAGHNFGFSTEIRTWFEYRGGENLAFSGDDDVWVFIAGQLALDLGGLHPPRSGAFVLDAATAATLNLTVGNVYEIALFHAERHSTGSNFNLTLGGFAKTNSTCESVCGDGIVAGNEICDDGVNDGSYGSCMPDCTPGPRCGDTVIQTADGEICDDGVNLTTYSQTGMAGCAPGCVPGAYCGDGNVDSLFGEACDDGINPGGYGQCEPNCTRGPHCGDGVRQPAEEACDDGNTVSGDGCSETCSKEGPN